MRNTAMFSLIFFTATILFILPVRSEDDSEGGCSIKIVKPCDAKENPDRKKDSDTNKDGKKKEDKKK